ncbi:hypothetical protein [Shimia sagamensis]|uniref:Uncharacterized protein n=1 Tax=Shimia sagamensis TaxID=1566352 RepID=A0ABY1PM07_9RHOB|nr:hypothetical protein [Shimia sagamensis]SMP37053.1 hypothetical protein SAMN06265373_1245 [Shimia sagamensis]
MDLIKLSPRKAADGGAVLHLKDPATGEELFDGDKPVTITVKGADSEAVQEARRDVERRRVSGEEISEAEAGAEFLAAVTMDWQGIGLGSTKSLKCNKENAKRLFLHPDAEWICGQVGPFSRDRRNFVKNRPSG